MSMTAEQLAAIMPAATDLLSDEPEMETSLHALQVRLLVKQPKEECHGKSTISAFAGSTSQKHEK